MRIDGSKARAERQQRDLDIHQHVIVSGLWEHLTTGNRVHQLTTDLGRNALVRLEAHQVQQGLLLVWSNVRLVALCKDQEGLVPQNGHGAGVHLEAQEVVHQAVNDLVGQGILLVE